MKVNSFNAVKRPLPHRNARHKTLLKPLHQVPPHSPHPCALAKDIHRHGRAETHELNDADDDKDLFRALGLEPVGEEEGEGEAVEDICSKLVSMSKNGGLKGKNYFSRN